jgi:hypothetical protein
MKLKKEEFDPKALDVELEPSRFKRYTGDVPRTGTILIHRVTKLWWTQTEDGTSMIKGLCVAEQNTGDKKKYNGLPTWAYLVFKPEAAFTYVPFLQCFGLTTRDIFNKMMVAEEADSIGDIIESLADWEVGSDDAVCRIVVKNDREYGAKVDREGWIPLDDVEDDDDDDEEEEAPARPTRRGRSTQAPARGDKAASARSRRASQDVEEEEADDEDDEDIEDDDDLDDELDDDEGEDNDQEDEDEEAEDEDQEEEEPPARTRRAKPATRSSRTPARSASSTRAASSGRSRPASDGSRTSSGRTPTNRAARDSAKRGSKDEPPF